MGQTGRMAVGHPVDVASGVLFNHFMDFALPGQLPLTFERFYSTGLLGQQRDEPLGPGWRHCFQHELRQTVDGFVYVDATGQEVLLADVGRGFEQTGRLVAPGAQMELRGHLGRVELQLYGSDNPTWRLCFVRRESSLEYVLTSIELNPKVKLTFGYDTRGRLLRVCQTRMNRELHLEYAAEGRVACVWYSGRGKDLVCRFTYDAGGHLSRVTDRVGEVAAFEYDAAHRMVSEARCTGAVYIFRYDTGGRCIYASGINRHEERTLQYDLAGRQTRVSDSHGHVTLYDYNEAGQITRLQTALGGKVHYFYDEQGRLVSTQNVHKHLQRLEYDEFGRLCAMSQGAADRQTLEYDQRHRPIRVVGYRGFTWTYEYDVEDRCTQARDSQGREWRFRYNDYGELEAARGPLGHEVHRHWDARGDLVAYTTQDGRVWRATHDDYGRRDSVTDPSGGVTRYTYDRAGNLATLVAPDGQRWAYTYEAGGRCSSIREPGGTQLRAQYNACGQIVQLHLADGTTQRFEWDTEPGRILAIEDGRKQRLEWSYDALGRLATRRHWDGSLTRFEFDLAANLTAIIAPTGERFENVFDEQSRLIERITPDGVRTQYEYDDRSQVVSIISPGSQLAYTYDVFGRLSSEMQNGTVIQHTYDAEGRKLSLQSDLGALARFEWTPEGLCSAIHGPQGTLHMRYGMRGEELERLLPGGASFAQSYDPRGRLVEQRYLPPGWTSGAEEQPAVADPEVPMSLRRRYGYDASGNVTLLDDSMRGRSSFTHDAVGRLQAVNRVGGQTELFDYDASGNRHTSARLNDLGPELPEGLFRRRQHGPSLLDLTELDRLGADVTVARTVVGNRTTELQCSGRHLRYEHDGRGRLVRKEVIGGAKTETWRYEWNAVDLLVAVLRPDGERWTYDYDALGRRIAKHGPSGTRRYVWDRLLPLHEIAPSGDVTTYVYQPGRPTPVVEQREGATLFVLTDLTGSASERVTAEGHVVWSARLGTWGEPPASAADGERGFPGQSYDAESGLYYNQARYYDPELGRYISPDPIGVLGGMNEYAYVPSPMGWSDVLGLSDSKTGGGLWSPGTNAEFVGPTMMFGTPNLIAEENRRVAMEDLSGDYKVASPNAQGAKGKCLAVIYGINDQSNLSSFLQEGKPAFVSGFGNPYRIPSPTEFAGLRFDQMGNFCHAEVQALYFLHMHQISGATIYVDRLPCSQCRGSLQGILDAHFVGLKVNLKFYNHEKQIYEDWKDIYKRISQDGAKTHSC